MHLINARNVHEALPEAVRYLNLFGLPRDSRNGKVLVAPEPVTTVYQSPRERVLFWPERDANPFFHFYESLWMLAGRNDVASLTRFVKRMKDFSEDGVIFHGAYGYRWRNWFDHDQLQMIANRLREDPTDRRQVLQMYDTNEDGGPNQKELKDVPCNLMATFQVNDFGALDMVVFNRSNDIVWGCYGANAVHFSFLQEFMAADIGAHVGTYTQVSANWHAYVSTFEPVLGLGKAACDPLYTKPGSPYHAPEMVPWKLVSTDASTWLTDLHMFLSEEDRAVGYRDPFFRRVACPIVATHNAFRENEGQDRFHAAKEEAKAILAPDWRLAINEWIDRRMTCWQEKQS